MRTLTHMDEELCVVSYHRLGCYLDVRLPFVYYLRVDDLLTSPWCSCWILRPQASGLLLDGITSCNFKRKPWKITYPKKKRNLEQ
jgi:hypothetical protein